MHPTVTDSAPLATHQQSWLHQAVNRDLLAELLADKRSPNTRRAYERDLRDFFTVVAGAEASPALVEQFLNLERFSALSLVLKYKAALIQKKLAEATINRRLAAVRSLVNYARKIGKCNYSLEDVSGERLQSYRDTSGVSSEVYRRLLDIPNRETVKGRRDYALLHLFWSNALRRNEAVQANVGDFDPDSKTLLILGKGRGTQKEAVTLSETTTAALTDWLSVRHSPKPADPLFISLDSASYGHRLTGNSVYRLVRQTAKAAGITKVMSPHRIRHSGITAALDATGGDVRRVQKLSRHSKLETLMLYDDARRNDQGQISDLLSNMI